jgi:competence protein ComEC
MRFWNNLPLFRLSIPLILGIIFSKYIYTEYSDYILVFLLFSLVFNQIFQKKSYKKRWLFGLLISLFFGVFGSLLLHEYSSVNKENYFGNYLQSENIFLLELVEEPIVKENSKKSIAKVLITNKSMTSGKILLYLDKELADLNYGSRLWVKETHQKISEPKNPHQFNYKKFLENRNVSYQLFVQEGNYHVSIEMGGNVLVKQAMQVRSIFLGIFEDLDWTKDEMAIGSALLLGYKNHMSQNVSQSFSA